MANALRRVGRSAVYWLIATVLLVSLTVSIFLLADVVHNHWFPVHLLLSAMFVVIGLALILIGSRAPATRVSDRPRQRSIASVVTPVSLVGLGLLGGGFLYGFTGNVDAIIYSFAGSVAVIVLVSVVASHRRRS
jgi:hypothetical protein